MSGVLALLLIVLAAQPTTASATTTPATPAWAFHGGRALLGQAPELRPPLKLRWTYHADESGAAAIEGAAAISDSTVYVADSRGVLHAIDLATGRRRWIYQAAEDGFASTPLICGGNVLVGDLAGTLHAVAADSGSKKWTADTGAPIHASANAAAPGAARIVIANDSGKILCLDPDGKTLWTAQAGDRINSAAAIAGETVYIAGCDCKLTVLNLSDGKAPLAPVDLSAVSGGSPAVINDRVIVGTDAGRVLCLDRADGTLAWSYEQIKDGAMVYASPAVAQGIVVIGARDRQVHAINLADGKPRWTFKTRLDVDSSPVISGGRVYVGSKDKSLYALDLKSGELNWEFKASRGIVATPAIGAGVLVISDMAGNVYCLEPR
jgi:outer membrane protein assembly factor BamB